MQMKELRSLDIGDEVRWDDPDNDTASGVYQISRIHTDSGRIESWDSILLITSNDSDSVAEVLASEVC